MEINHLYQLLEAPKKPQMPSFDVDDLVKRIDAKIAELEAQEKAEEEAKKNDGSVKPDAQTVPAMPSITSKSSEGEKVPSPIPEITKEEIPSMPSIKTMADLNIESQKSPMEKNESNINVNMVESASIQEVKAEPVGNDLAFNPFNNDSKPMESKFIDKDIIDGVETPIETSPITAPVIEPGPKEIKTPDNDKIEKFEDLMNRANPIMPEAKPSTMINNPIGTDEAPQMPTEPIIAPPKVPSLEDTQLLEPIDVSKIDNDSTIETLEAKPLPLESSISSFPGTQPNNSNTNVVINNQGTAGNNQTSNDAFFDDFFDND